MRLSFALRPHRTVRTAVFVLPMEEQKLRAHVAAGDRAPGGGAGRSRSPPASLRFPLPHGNAASARACRGHTCLQAAARLPSGGGSVAARDPRHGQAAPRPWVSTARSSPRPPGPRRRPPQPFPGRSPPQAILLLVCCLLSPPTPDQPLTRSRPRGPAFLARGLGTQAGPECGTCLPCSPRSGAGPCPRPEPMAERAFGTGDGGQSTGLGAPLAVAAPCLELACSACPSAGHRTPTLGGVDPHTDAQLPATLIRQV